MTGTVADSQCREELDEADGYFSEANVPGRNLPMSTTEQNQNDEAANEAEDEEVEDRLAESIEIHLFRH